MIKKFDTETFSKTFPPRKFVKTKTTNVTSILAKKVMREMWLLSSTNSSSSARHVRSLQ